MYFESQSVSLNLVIFDEITKTANDNKIKLCLVL